MPKLDPSIAAALNIDPSTATVSSHGGSGFSSTLKVSSGDKLFFVKQGTGRDAEVMFAGEHASLNAISSAVPSLCPKSFAHGALSNSSGFFLATEFLNLSGSSRGGGGESLASKLSKLHQSPSPDGRYGFDVPTCCGSTVQDNSWETTWADFFITRRLHAIITECERKNGSRGELRKLISSNTFHSLLSRFEQSDPEAAKAVVVHGDLWSGNKSAGTIHGRTSTPEAVVYDPSSCYAAAEYDHGIMRMFGGFDGGFWEEYWKTCPKGKPVEEYDDRVALYEAYHQLNHFALFGGGYGDSAIRILKRLEKKYGSKVNS